MREDTKTILVKESIHKELKDYSEKTGIKMKVLVETAIKYYLKKIIIVEEE